MRCGLIFNSDNLSPKDREGCCLENGHLGPHAFTGEDGFCYQWETDFNCDCEHCSKCLGDYCTVYWRVES